MNKVFAIGLLILASSLTHAQEIITLDQAIEEALRSNINIRIARAQVDAAENRATYGQAGLMPSVNGSGSVDYGVNNTKIQLTGSPNAIETDGAASTTYRAGLNLNYTIFSGFANKRTYDKLVLTASQSESQSRLQIEGIVLQVANAYFNVLRSESNLDALKKASSISRERTERARMQKELSGGSSIILLNAQVDMNQDSVNVINAEQALAEAKINFNRLLGRALDAEVNVVLGEEVPELDEYEALKSQMMNQNADQISQRVNEQISMMDYKISKSAYLPKLNFTGSYAYSRNEAEGSFLQVNESLGYNLGLSLSVPIYNGGTKRIAQKNAQIQMETSQLQREDTERILESDLLIAYRDFQNSLRALELEKVSLETAQRNFDLSQERYNLGQITSTDFRTAQINLLLSENNLNNLMYNVQLTALEVIRISGGLMQ